MWTSEKEIKRCAYGKKFGLIVFMLLVAPLMIFPAGSAITWDQEKEISTDSNQNEYQRDPAIAAENGKVYTVWGRNDGKDYDIIFRENDGVSWLAEEPLTDDMNIEQFNPDIAVENGVVHVVWHDSVNGDWDIMYIKRDGGVWGAVEEISVDMASETQWYPKIAASDGNVYVVWQDGRDGDWDIYFTYNNGISWSTPVQINTEIGNEAQTYPRIAAGGGKAYVVWEDAGSGNKDIKLRVFDGSSWGSIMTVSQDPPDVAQEEPDVAFDGGVVHVVWQQLNGTDADIFYRSWNGISFSAIQTLNKDIGTEFQFGPAITAQFGKVHVVWADARDGGTDRDIMYRQYDGFSWQPLIEEISNDTGVEPQNNPEIAAENGTVHVVWEEQDPVNLDIEIFYRKGYEAQPPDTFPPLVTNVRIDGVTDRTIPVGTPSVTLTATIDDSSTGNSDIGGANYTMGQAYWPSSIDMIPDDPPLNSPIEPFYATIDTSLLGIGTYEIWVYGWDNQTNKNIIGAYATLNVGSFSIDLEKGWNLVSFPHLVPDTSLGYVLDSIDGDYNILSHYNASDTDDFWKVYNIHKPINMNDLDYLDNKLGFWIHITALGGTTLTLDDPLPSTPQTIPLSLGWNLVGYPSLVNKDRTTALNNLTFGTQVNSIWTYNATSKQWKEIVATDHFETGRGYWIHAIEECEWVVDN